MKKLIIPIILAIFLNSTVSAEKVLYDCKSPRPEMVGTHNMVLFGDPSDALYTYHLPLFRGKINGMNGHVLMHLYQGLWRVEFDNETKLSYLQKFNHKKTKLSPIPFFSISPKGKKFKVPEMICSKGFETEVLSVYGHIERNPHFPAPEALINKNSLLKVHETVFAKRFNGEGKNELTYVVFGTQKQIYMAHFLTDDENSFDQIIAVELLKKDIGNSKLLDAVLKNQFVLITIPLSMNSHLDLVENSKNIQSPNNKFMLPSNPLGEAIIIDFDGTKFTIKVTSSIYFNNNGDLKIK